jgi:hypothetical protein
MQAVAELAPDCGVITAACAALDLSRASFHRRQAAATRPPVPVRPRPKPARALAANERRTVISLLRAEPYADLAPAEVYASLLDQGTYHCSIRTMYRILHEHDEIKERRRQLRHPIYQKPELLAEGPNQVWSWDITKLMGPENWTYFYLYVIIDIFSRRVVGRCVADTESSASRAGVHMLCDVCQFVRTGPIYPRPVTPEVANMYFTGDHYSDPYWRIFQVSPLAKMSPLRWKTSFGRKKVSPSNTKSAMLIGY